MFAKFSTLLEGLVAYKPILLQECVSRNLDLLVRSTDTARQALGAVKAVTAASLAIAGEDVGFGAVSLE